MEKGTFHIGAGRVHELLRGAPCALVQAAQAAVGDV